MFKGVNAIQIAQLVVVSLTLAILVVRAIRRGL